MSELLSVKQAQSKILEHFCVCPPVRIPILRAHRRVLGQTIRATTDLPSFTNSGMDGYAVHAADTRSASAQQPVQLPVVMDIPAGTHPSQPLQPGSAARIMTGAPLPNGADAVIPLESIQTTSVNHLPGILISAPIQTGDSVREKGQDIQFGQPVLQASAVLRPQDIGMLATLGIASVSVYRKPRVAILSTGDELVPPGKPLAPGQIRESNSYTLATLARAHGAQIISLGIAPDDPSSIERHLDRALDQKADLILTSAGVSVGAFDYVRAILEKNGALNFWRVNLRPGKPLAFGNYRGTPVIGLPGNPVSSYIGFHVFVIPVLRKLSGQANPALPVIKAAITQPLQTDGRETYFRANISWNDGKISATLSGHQGSGNLFGLVLANALLIVPSGVKSLPIGAEVDAVMIGE